MRTLVELCTFASACFGLVSGVLWVMSSRIKTPGSFSKPSRPDPMHQALGTKPPAPAALLKDIEALGAALSKQGKHNARAAGFAAAAAFLAFSAAIAGHFQRCESHVADSAMKP